GGLRSEAVHDALEVETLQQLHHVVEAAALIHAEVVELHGMRRAQTRRHLCLALESTDELLARRARLHLLSNQLDGGRTRKELVLREPDFAHAAGSERRNQAVTADGQAVVEQLFV